MTTADQIKLFTEEVIDEIESDISRPLKNILQEFAVQLFKLGQTERKNLNLAKSKGKK